MPKAKNEKMVLISVHLPRTWISIIDTLVEKGVFHSRSEAIRTGLYALLEKYLIEYAHDGSVDSKCRQEPEIEVIQGR
jgi:Arc/MetJ-type ribon-helix-helix transcriptional regulator